MLDPQSDADSAAKVPVDKWSKVEVVYDLKSLRVFVNGKPGPRAPCAVRGFSFSAAAFGGHGADVSKYFEGYLKGLRIAHYALR